MDVRFRISVVHLDAVPPVCFIALVHPTKVCYLKTPIAIRDGAANDGGAWHSGRILRVCYNLPEFPIKET